MLHKNVSKSDKLGSVSLGAALMWTWLLTHVDDNGNYEDDPVLLKAHVLPKRRDVSLDDVQRFVEELVNVRNGDDRGLLARYEANGRKYLHFIDFERYQKLVHRDRCNAECPPHPETLGPTLVAYKRATGTAPLFAPETATPTAPEVKLSEAKKKSASPAAPAEAFAVETYKKKFGETPNWGREHFVQCASLFHRKKELTLDEFKRRWIFYLKSTDPFYAKNGYALGFFCSKAFDALRSGPLDERGAVTTNPGVNRKEMERRREELSPEAQKMYQERGVRPQ
jgi:hypothetical protein